MATSNKPKPIGQVAAEVANEVQPPAKITPEEKLEIGKSLIIENGQPAHTEAKVAINWYEVSPNGRNCQITIREGATIALLYETLETAALASKWFEDAGWTPGGQPAKPSRPQQAEKPAAPAAPASKPTGRPSGRPAARQPSQEQPEETVERPVNTLRCVYIEVQPRPDQKTSVKFFGNTRKRPHDEFASVILTDTPEAVAQMLTLVDPTFTDDDFRTAWADTFVCDVLWQESERLNTQGNPYRDIVGINPVE